MKGNNEAQVHIEQRYSGWSKLNQAQFPQGSFGYVSFPACLEDRMRPDMMGFPLKYFFKADSPAIGEALKRETETMGNLLTAQADGRLVEPVTREIRKVMFQWAATNHARMLNHIFDNTIDRYQKFTYDPMLAVLPIDVERELILAVDFAMDDRDLQGRPADPQKGYRATRTYFGLDSGVMEYKINGHKTLPTNLPGPVQTFVQKLKRAYPRLRGNLSLPAKSVGQLAGGRFLAEVLPTHPAAELIYQNPNLPDSVRSVLFDVRHLTWEGLLLARAEGKLANIAPDVQAYLAKVAAEYGKI